MVIKIYIITNKRHVVEIFSIGNRTHRFNKNSEIFSKNTVMSTRQIISDKIQLRHTSISGSPRVIIYERKLLSPNKRIIAKIF